MRYQKIRDHIKSGDLIALTHTEWDSLYDLQVQAVRIFTQSEYAHVALAWVVGGRVFLIESVTPKIRLLPLSNLKDVGFYWLPTHKEMTDAELEYGLSMVGSGEYSKLQAIAGQLETLHIGEDDNWQCSELVIAMRRKSGVYLGDKATPSAVVKAAQGLGNPTYYVKNE